MDLKEIDVKDPKQLITYGDDFFGKSAKFNHKQRRKWLLNILFIVGEQLCYINERTGNIVRVKTEDDPDYVVRVVNNRIMPIYRTMIAKLTKSQPIPMATANSRQDKDVQAARACTKLMENHWLTLELDEGIQDIAGWLVSCGNVFVKQFYNPTKGGMVSLDDDIVDNIKQSIMEQDPENEDDTNAIMSLIDNKKVPLGDTDLVIRNPFCCYPEPGKTRLKEMRIFGDSEFLSPEEVFEKYKVEVDPTIRPNDGYVFSASIGDIIDSGGLDFQDTRTNMVEVREIHILPNSTFKNGAKYKWAGDKLIGKLEPCDEIPFTQLGLINVPGKLWYEALITDLIPMQKRWNELLSKIEMHNDLYNDPPIVINPNVIDIEEWVAKPGLILEKKLSGVAEENPWVMPVPMLDQSIFQEINILDKQFEIVPVLNKVSFGKDTPNARSGLAINYLQEKDDDVIRPLVANLEIGFTKIFKRDFRLCQKHYKEDRGFAIVGPDNKVEWIDLVQSDLMSNTTVRIAPGSAMPKSIAAQQAMILELMDRGFFVNPKTGQMDYGRISRYMEFGGIEEMYEDITIDIDHARRCLDTIQHGEYVEVKPWFNAVVHLDQINCFRKTTTYEEADLEIQANVDDYAKQCELLLQPAAPSATPDLAPGGVSDTTAPVASNSAPSVAPVQAPAVNAAGATPSLPVGGGEEEGGGINQDIVEGALSVIKVLAPEAWAKVKEMNPDQLYMMVQDIMKQAKV